MFLLGRRWFNLPVAVSGTLLYIFSSQLLIFSNSGLTESMSVLMMLAWVYLLYRAACRWLVAASAGRGGRRSVLPGARLQRRPFFLPAWSTSGGAGTVRLKRMTINGMDRVARH